MQLSKIAATALAAMTISLGASAAMADETRTFYGPRVSTGHGEAFVSTCLTRGRGCGQAAAKAFCRSKRYDRLLAFRGGRTPRNKRVYFLGSGENEKCGEVSCAVIAEVVCQKARRHASGATVRRVPGRDETGRVSVPLRERARSSAVRVRSGRAHATGARVRRR